MRKFSSILKNDEVMSIAIGKFDSMHLAHKAVLKYLDKNDIVLLIKTPQHLRGSILPYRKRENYTKRKIYFIDFEKIKNLSGKKFLKYIQTKLPNLRTIIVGDDFRFGKNRKYSAKNIPEISNLNVIIIPEIKIDGIAVHSSYIRKFILNGEINLANKLLGRFYSIEGNVISGQGIGKERLFPTFNINAGEYILPKDGVYASYTKIGKDVFKSTTFIGNRLSTNMSFAIETHIIDRVINDNPKKIEIFFVKRIRDNKKFQNLDSLKHQIMVDIECAKEILDSSFSNIEQL
ncbi:riboflavin biosynthesis protein RibF [Helicobacter sp. 16-1353]|uniref:bifunctional riboflavin kinase/FAD synthetase n=1 Tax=Helicobacter sp. 16-1353 TaxID=2004996 RepID=UPI000DCCFF96|nr:bifunctional riboflavin kinase/FAD synthetase [Helicobacter sp. 16-1353]RAX53056.1 riboflavin biosynthesis protein RibF [Helicobacter sp. 16-1353]